MDKADLGYLAAVLDCEGTVTANLRGRSVHYRVIAFNTDDRLMQWLKQVAGGRVSRYGTPRSPTHQQVFSWYLGGAPAAALLTLVLSHLKLKRRQAELVIELHELAMPRHLRSRTRVSDELYARRLPLVEEMARLNHRGAGGFVAGRPRRNTWNTWA
jgi:hypothetical protein